MRRFEASVALSFSLSSTLPIAPSPLGDTHRSNRRNFSTKMFAVRSIGLLLCSGGERLAAIHTEFVKSVLRRGKKAGAIREPASRVRSLSRSHRDFTLFLFDASLFMERYAAIEETRPLPVPLCKSISHSF